jgi:hypothetical protein
MKFLKFSITALFVVLGGFMALADPSAGTLFMLGASVAVTSGYNGEVADVIMTALKTGNEAVEKGSVYVEAGVQERLAIPRFTTADDVLAAAVADPVTAADAFSWTERSIVPASMMFFDKVNPRNFESVWRPFQPQGPLVDRVDNPKIVAALTEEATKSVGKQLGKLVWQGDTAGAAPLAFFDGFIKIIDASTAIHVTPAGVISAANVISVLEACEAAIPAAIWGDTDVVFHMNTTDYRLYLQAARALDFKGPNIGDANLQRFAGREIRFYEGLPKDRIVVCKATSGKDSNLWAGVDVSGDEENVKIQRFRPESENFIVKILFKYGVQIAVPEEIVFYEPA